MRDNDSAACHGRWLDDEGGVAELEFLLLTPASMVEATESELADEFDADRADGRIASVALRRWRALAAEDVSLIERLADADFTVSYHADTDISGHRDGSVSVTAAMWFPTLADADSALQTLGAHARWAYSPVGPTSNGGTRFVVGFGGVRP